MFSSGLTTAPRNSVTPDRQRGPAFCGNVILVVSLRESRQVLHVDISGDTVVI